MIWNFKEPKEFKKIITAAAFVWNLDKADVLSSDRSEPLATARAVLIVSLRERYRLTYANIGLLFGGRDHGTIIYHVKNHIDRMDGDPDYKENYIKINQYLDNLST